MCGRSNVAPPPLNQHHWCLIAHWCHLLNYCASLGCTLSLGIHLAGLCLACSGCLVCLAPFVVIFKYRWPCWLGQRCESVRSVASAVCCHCRLWLVLRCLSSLRSAVEATAVPQFLLLRSVRAQEEKRKPFAASSPGAVAPSSTPSSSHSPLWAPVAAAVHAAPGSQPHHNSCWTGAGAVWQTPLVVVPISHPLILPWHRVIWFEAFFLVVWVALVCPPR